ncbi:MAG: tRNA dihydrouridine synthase DusB [Planctomycetota bacterium]
MRSDANVEVPLAQPGEFAPLRIGPLTVDPPVVLAPMAGVTNAPYRTLCRRFSGGRCLYVSEMITAKSFAMGHAKTRRLASFAPDETTRSLQLYGTNADSLAEATQILVAECGVDHIDLNFGCPVPKVTSQGGGSAIPARPALMARLVTAVVQHAGAVPVTVKFRKGIDDDLLTYRDAGRVAEESGARAVALHARTAAQLYAGEADWAAIADLKARVRSIPVLGNGDIFEAFDALRMMRATGCDGVVIGRGCLGRPWLFGELVDAFDGREPREPPRLGQVVDTALEHAALLVDFFGERGGIQNMRKFLGWYLKSFRGTRQRLPTLHRVETLAALRDELGTLPRDEPFPAVALRARRAKGGRTQRVSLPQGFLDGKSPEPSDPLHVVDGG